MVKNHAKKKHPKRMRDIHTDKERFMRRH